jgi:ATP-dependent helicase/nuclease subunit B
MGNNLLDLSDFDNIASENVLVLTPNLRLQRRFSHSYGLAQGSAGKTTWHSPEVFALNTWLQSTWLELQDCAYAPAANYVLADANQLHALWTETISSDAHEMGVINPTALASPAMDAFRTLQLWCLNDFSALSPDALESESYHRWYDRMIAELTSRHWVTPETCIEVICKALRDGVLKLPNRVVLFSWDEYPPLINKLFEAFGAAGAELRHSDSESQPDSVSKVATRERADQYLLAAQWAKAALERKHGVNVAIVCPELTKYRSEIEDAFVRVFEPQALLPEVPRYTLPFNFSAGVPLGDIPLIRDALDFIALGERRAPHSTISALLRSPYIAGAEQEQLVRARFDLILKEGHSNTLKLDNVIQMMNCPERLAESIAKFLSHTSNTTTNQKPSQWAYHFGRSLEALGWPGDRNLDSEEFQALTHWHAQLDQLSKLDAVYTECSRSKALSLLRQCVSRTVFQPETADSPVQILGILEAAGLHFDYMWVMDLNDDIWPQAPQPNPFIPMSAQKAFNMPHATSERELAFSKRIVERLIAGADHLVMSYAEWDNDKELRCSSLIHDIAHIDKDDLTLAPIDDYTRILYRAIPAISITESPVTVVDPSTVRGGTGILSSQAKCPFQAFAKYRLKANELPEIILGLSHTDRGDLVHLVLEFIWKKLENQTALLALQGEEEVQLINEAIDYAFFWLKSRRVDLGERLLGLERQRLLTVIGQWLQLERGRQPFTVVSCEERVNTNIGGLPIQIKRDRVDEVEGRRFHIDYKTGLTSLNDWAGERPDSPQVPLYAVVENDDCVGAAYGQIRKGGAALKGIAETSGIAYGVVPADALKVDLPSTWADIKAHWTDRLQALAREFLTGVADVMPKSSSTCQMCHLANLCRR